MVGLLADVSVALGSRFTREGDIVALLGTTRDEMGAGAYLADVLGRDEGPCPSLDLASVRAAVNLLVEIVGDGMVSSAHDVSSGGLAVALAECSGGGLGAAVNVGTSLAATRALFAESAGRALVSLPSGRERNLVDAAPAASRSPCSDASAGTVSPDRQRAPAIDLPVARLLAASENAFARLMEVHS